MRLYKATTPEQVVAEMLDWADAPAFVDEEGRLCVRDAEPQAGDRRVLDDDELSRLHEHYQTRLGDLAGLRRRMILEGGWQPECVGVDGEHLFVVEEG